MTNGDERKFRSSSAELDSVAAGPAGVPGGETVLCAAASAVALQMGWGPVMSSS